MHHWELTQDTSIESCRQLLKQPPGPWPQDWFSYPNICEAFRQNFKEAAEQAPPGPDNWKAPRGIVICGGGWRFFPSIYVTVRQIRFHGCNLPIQIWFLGDKNEFDVRMQMALEPYDVSWICANSYQRENGIPRRILGGWEVKPFAALHAPFQEVICLDADSYPAYNPEVFMAHPEYQRVGAAFWPDQQQLELGQWERFGLEWHDEQAFESGQYIVDKGRHYKALWLADWMNDHSDYVYRHIYGDKDTFHLAWRMAGHECCIPTTHPGWHWVAFLQKDFDGKTLFVHRTRDKFRWDGDIDGQEVPRGYMTGQYNHTVQYIHDMPDEHLTHAFCRESSQLLRPELHFHFDDGPNGVSRKTWMEVALHNEYKLPGKFLNSDVVIDVGAHMGAFSWSCARRGAGCIVALEPNASSIAYMQKNLDSLPVDIQEKALWSTTGAVQVSDSPMHAPGVSTTYNLVYQGQGQSVQTISFDDLISLGLKYSKNNRIRMIKLDCEGGEYSLLIASKLDVVDEICGEIHRGVCFDGKTHSTEDVCKRLIDAGFVVSVTQNGPNTDLLWATRK